MSKRKNRKNRRSQSAKMRTPVEDHRRVGPALVPPLVDKMGDKLMPVSWMDDRLPEMLWAVLIAGSRSQDEAVSEFRRVLSFVANHERREDLHDLTHSGIAALEAPLRTELISCITESPNTMTALSCLRMFEHLPARQDWLLHLPDFAGDGDLLTESVGRVLWHQSQEATDCRWLRITGKCIAGKRTLPRNLLEDLLQYPNVHMEKVRPMVRAFENITLPDEISDSNWPAMFWGEVWSNTSCIITDGVYDAQTIVQNITRQKVNDLKERLIEHWNQTHSTTAVDPKHDGVFGMAFYCLRLLDEMMGINIWSSVLGRLGLRTILEVRINMQYLIAENDTELWKNWRRYGAGQAKLNALKFEQASEMPDYVDISTIEVIASEDISEEMLTINLANWTKLDLRRISDQTGLKATYDAYYSWTSGYAHGMWGPIRESCFQTCLNPLHRLHRVPKQDLLPDVVEDAAGLVDEALDLLDSTYPSFKTRLLKDDATSTASQK